MRKHWTRWIYASIAKHFAAVAEANDVYFYLAGKGDDTCAEFLELTVTGPTTNQRNNGYYVLEVDVGVIYSVYVSGYQAQVLSGLIEEAMTDICIYKYGDGPDDDNTFLGILQIRSPIETDCFGQIKSDTRLIQGYVSASLQMTIKRN